MSNAQQCMHEFQKMLAVIEKIDRKTRLINNTEFLSSQQGELLALADEFNRAKASLQKLYTYVNNVGCNINRVYGMACAPHCARQDCLRKIIRNIVMNNSMVLKNLLTEWRTTCTEERITRYLPYFPSDRLRRVFAEIPGFRRGFQGGAWAIRCPGMVREKSYRIVGMAIYISAIAPRSWRYVNDRFYSRLYKDAIVQECMGLPHETMNLHHDLVYAFRDAGFRHNITWEDFIRVLQNMHISDLDAIYFECLKGRKFPLGLTNQDATAFLHEVFVELMHRVLARVERREALEEVVDCRIMVKAGQYLLAPYMPDVYPEDVDIPIATVELPRP